jgi:hypothetical protein
LVTLAKMGTPLYGPGMKTRLITLVAVTLLAGTVLAVGALAATDISGTWNASVQTSAGSGSPTFVLKQDGDKLTGTYNGTFGSAPVTGTVNGNDVTLEFTPSSGSKAKYTGKLDSTGKKMEGTCDYGGGLSGTFTATKQ